MGAFLNDLQHVDVGETGCKGPLLTAGKETVEIAAIRQVPGVIDESKNIHHGDGKQGPLQGSEPFFLNQAPDDFDPQNFVTMQGGTDKKPWPLFPAVDDVNRHGHLSMCVESGNRNIDSDLMPGFYGNTIDPEVFLHIKVSL